MKRNNLIKKQLKIKNLLENLIIKKGHKFTVEKLLKKSIKSFNKNLKKKFLSVVKVFLINTNEFFKISEKKHPHNNKRKNKDKKKITFIDSEKKRITYSFKFILDSLKKKPISNNLSIYKKFLELLLNFSKNTTTSN